MSNIDPTPEWTHLAQQARQLAASSDEMQTAAGLREIVHEVYTATKQHRPPVSGGLDGRDSDERAGIGHVRDAAEDHYHRSIRRAHGGRA